MSNFEGSIIIFECGNSIITKIQKVGWDDWIGRDIFWITLANDEEYEITFDEDGETGKIYQTEINFQIL